jgi:tetratricopeptide (TPR) repeat protein
MGKALVLVYFIACAVFAQQSAPELELDLQKHPDRLSVRLQLANIYLAQKQFDRVIALLNPYTDQLTNQGFLALGNAYSNKQDYTNEVRVLGLLVAKEDDNFQWHMLLGEAYLKQASVQKPADYEKRKDFNTNAIQQFRRALHLSPKYKPAFNILLTTLLQQKAHNEAREVISEGINKFGDRPELYSELCRLDSNDGYLAQAVKSCRMAIKIAPDYPDNYVYMVQALYDQKEEQQAESDMVSAARKFGHSEFVQWAAGMIFLKKKNYAVSQRYFATALSADPKSGRSQFGLAQSLFESGDEKGSYEHFMKACAADPSTVDTFLAAGGRLKQKGNYQLGDKFVTSATSCKSTK